MSAVVKTPPGFAESVHLIDSELQHQVLLMAALKMFELGKVSSGKAAELAGMSRGEFLEKCGQYKVSLYNYGADELERELKLDIETIEKLDL